MKRKAKQNGSQVGIADLKARLSEVLRGVRRGATVTVMDRDTPVAQIIPYTTDRPKLIIRYAKPGAPRLGELKPPKALALEVDIVKLLLEERRDRM